MANKKEMVRKKIRSEMRKLANLVQLLKGNIYEVNKKTKSAGYNVFQLTYKGANNITKTVYIKKEMINNVKKAINNYKIVKQIIDKVVDANIELIKHGSD